MLHGCFVALLHFVFVMVIYGTFYLNKKFNCVLQLGGSDQWGNIVIGMDLIKKTINKKCFIVCSALTTYLNLIGYENDLIWGSVCDTSDIWAHYWLKTSDQKIIDPTAGQFCKFSELKDGIYIGDIPSWYLEFDDS